MMLLPLICKDWFLACTASATAKAVSNAGLNDIANSMMEAQTKFAASLGTMWVNVSTPLLTGSSNGGVAAGEHGEQAAGLASVLSWTTWIGLGVAVLSLIGVGAVMALRPRDGSGHVHRSIVVLMATMLIGAAASITAAVMPSTARASSPVALLQNGLWYYMAAIVIVSIIVAGIQMAWTQRAEPGKELVRSLLTMIVVSGAGVAIVGFLTAAADGFSTWLLSASLRCNVGTDANCFAHGLTTIVSFATISNGQIGVMAMIVLAALAVLISLAQCVLMLARGAVLIVLVGVLPSAAAATNTEMGRQWFSKVRGWIIAFILYKPAAAIIYAVAFKLVGTDLSKGDTSGISQVLMGLVLMCLSLVALPALMRTVVPQTAAAAGGGGLGAGMAGAGLAALPTGAAHVTSGAATMPTSTTSQAPAVSQTSSAMAGGSGAGSTLRRALASDDAGQSVSGPAAASPGASPVGGAGTGAAAGGGGAGGAAAAAGTAAARSAGQFAGEIGTSASAPPGAEDGTEPSGLNPGVGAASSGLSGMGPGPSGSGQSRQSGTTLDAGTTSPGPSGSGRSPQSGTQPGASGGTRRSSESTPSTPEFPEMGGPDGNR